VKNELTKIREGKVATLKRTCDSGREDAPKDRWYLGCCRCGGDDACWSAGGRRGPRGGREHLSWAGWMSMTQLGKWKEGKPCVGLLLPTVRVPPVVVVI